MPDDDELTADEVAYMESGGKTPLPGISETPAASTPDPASTPSAQPVGAAQPVAGTQPAAAVAAEAGAVAIDDADGDETLPEGIRIVQGKDGRARLVGNDGKFVRSVPHRALHKEREAHKATKAELLAEKERRARIDERVAILNEAFSAAKTGGQPGQGQAQAGQGAGAPAASQNPLEEADIDIDQDPFGAIKQLQRRNAFLQQQMSSSSHQQTVRDTFTNVQNQYRSDAARLLQEKPEFGQAYSFLVAGRHAELAALGEQDEGKRNAAIAREEATIVINAMKSGKSPAQAVFDLAVARGFVKPAAPAGGQGAQPATAAAAAKPTASASAATAAAEKLKQIRAGQTAAATLSNSGGSAHEGLTSDSLANMSDEEFSAAVDRMSLSQMKQLM